MSKALEVIKELRLFIALFATSGGVSIINYELALDYVHLYNIHLMALTVVGIYISHYLSLRRHNQAGSRLDTYQKQLNQVMTDAHISQLKGEVRQAFKDYDHIETIDFPTTIKYLRGLEERRKDLKINSYTEESMSMLLSKIKKGVV